MAKKKWIWEASPKKKEAAVVSILALSWFFPVLCVPGVILTWTWTRWSKWVKLFITSQGILTVLVLSGGILYALFWRPFQVRGDAMAPAYLDGQYIAVKLLKEDTLLNRGDAIILRSPVEPDKEYLKRIVGLPGESIMLQDGAVYINGKKLNESTYVPADIRTYGAPFLNDGQIFVIPAGNYFVLGDNRANSYDSRHWAFLKREKIVGIVAFCYWNCN